MIFGTFDILHAGHVYVFTEARKLGDRLVVVVARDSTVKKVKGQRPFHHESERVALLNHIDLIDEVCLGDKKDMYKVIREIRPEIIALGYDQAAFVPEMQKMLGQFKISTRIVRLNKYRNGRHKSSNIKKRLENNI